MDKYDKILGSKKKITLPVYCIESLKSIEKGRLGRTKEMAPADDGASK